MHLDLQLSSGLLVLWSFCMIGKAGDVTVGTVTAHPGETATGFLKVPAGSDAGTDIPVIIINGSKPGPILGLISGSHGTEYGSIVALPKLAHATNPAELSGTVVILPLVNVASFLQKVPHRNSIDNRGMNGYPGKSDGTQSERAVSAIYEQVIQKCDYLIDYHGGDLDENILPFAYWTKANKEPIDSITRDMLLAFGLEMIVTKSGGRSLDNTAIMLGQPCITVLGGRAGTASPEDVDVLVRGTVNVMRHLKMLPGAVKLIEHPLWLSHYEVLKGDQEGMFYPLVVPEAYVQKGMRVGYITNYFGEKVSDILAPVSGVIVYIAAVPSVKKGDNLGYVGELAEPPAASSSHGNK
jgi:predicted deacylase